ncbi:hypothetical protein CHS0354_025235 [Potamilus streckersoni]|uniref:HECT-type E3 ubiquitin transferase n=1 Tax=Potamilus streckersoni TaxID=2493646 RepID=A0AAE0RTY7_9BIVA|nr:hypothetical protein CHS0354_025235 [Potamilus streckersoni]
MEDCLKKNVELLLKKSRDLIQNFLDSDKERLHLLWGLAECGVSPEEIAHNLGDSVQTVRILLKAEKFRRSLENVSDVVITDIVSSSFEIVKEIQSIKNEKLTETDSKAKASGKSEQHSEPEIDLDQRKFFRELGLPVTDLARLLDISETDTAALLGACTLSDQMSESEFQTSESNIPQTTEAMEPLEWPTGVTAQPQNPQPEECAVKELCSDYKELRQAISDLKHSLNQKREKITIIDRSNIVNEVVDLYDKHPSIAMHELRVMFEGEEGLDYGGVTKDMLASFWTAASCHYFHGEDTLVPHVNLDQIRKGETNLKVIGRILSHTVALTGTLPFNISAVCLISAFHGGNSWMSEMDLLLEEYLMFVNSEEKLLMEKAQTNFASLTDNEKDYLMRVFETHGHRCLPTQANIKDKLADIAVKILIHEPARHLQQIKEGMPEIHIQVFWSRLSKEALRKLAEKLRPTPERTASILFPTRQLSDKESEVYTYLVHFVESLDKKSLRIFLQFVTGYTRLPKDGIKINFNPELKGAFRRPIAHTCSNQLDLPVEYKDLDEFMTEMTSLLDNPLAMNMYLE